MFNRKLLFSGRILVFSVLILAMLSTSVIGTSALGKSSTTSATVNALGNYAIVFVSRALSTRGSVYYSAGGIMPGVSGYSRFQVAAPGKLIVREANGTLRTLIDGSNPTAASLNLIDVNAPDVSYDGTKIVFAGIVAGSYQTGPLTAPGAWRIYVINVDGTGLRQLTFSDRNINLSQFGNNAYLFTSYDDTDPAWLPDGRIVFSSTRWPSFGMYGGVRTTNLHVINADGTGMHRITAERNGADRPVVDPLTGKIVYSRWWRNFRVATDSMATIANPDGGYIMKDGLCAINHSGTECQEVGGVFNLDRNAWHLGSINPDGTGLVQFAGRSNSSFVGEIANHAYGGAFAPDGSFYANFFPMANGTEAAGFGGIRRFTRGANGYIPIIGITTRDESILQFVSTNPNSYGVYVGNYAADPVVLPDGSLLISWAANVAQDYGLYTINADGSGLAGVYDSPGTTELRAKLIITRALPPVIPDQVTQVASALPPLEAGPYDIDGTFQFQALNVYFNAPVDTNILSAPPVGSANTIRFFIDHQRSQQRGSHEELDFPILLKEVLISPSGAVSADVPANVPLFEQLRTSQEAGYKVPFPASVLFPGDAPGATHVAGLNFGRPGITAQCVGCHAGHTMIPVPDNPADAQWTNLAPGATVTYSSLHTSLTNGKGAIDRKVKLKLENNNHRRYWFSREGENPNTQWLQLTFPVPVTVRTVRLYNIPSTASSIKVLNTTVRLYFDAAGTQQIASAASGALSDSGTDVAFNDVPARVVRIQFTSVNGSTAGLGEVEVIARGESDIPSSVISGNAGAPGAILNIAGGGQAVAGTDGSYSIRVPNGWSGTVTPSLPGVTFTPANRSYTNVTANQTEQNYTASVTLSGNAGVAGAALSYSDGTLQTATADGSGNYSLTVPYGWSGTITPSLAADAFCPASQTYNNLRTSQTAQNYAHAACPNFDGMSKWISAFDKSHGWTVSQYVRTVGDVNGDGKDDVVGFGLDGVYVSLSTGSGFSAAKKWTNAFDKSHGWTVSEYVRTIGDVSGDGKDDVVGFGKDGVYVGLSTGNGFSPAKKWTSAFDRSHGWTVKDYVRTVGDVNGDGKVDLIGFGLDGVYVALSTGSGFSAVSKWTSAFDLSHGWTVSQYVRTVGDVNGDGRVDVVGFGQDGVYVALSTGNSFSAARKWTSAFDLSHGWTVSQYVRTVGDVNGDGQADVVGYGQDGVYIALSMGNTFSLTSRRTTDFNSATQGWTVSQQVRTVGDVNGGGKADLVGFGLDGVYISLAQ